MIYQVVHFHEIIFQFEIHDCLNSMSMCKNTFFLIRSDERIGLTLFSENRLIYFHFTRMGKNK